MICNEIKEKLISDFYNHCRELILTYDASFIFQISDCARHIDNYKELKERIHELCSKRYDTVSDILDKESKFKNFVREL